MKATHEFWELSDIVTFTPKSLFLGFGSGFAECGSSGELNTSHYQLVMVTRFYIMASDQVKSVPCVVFLNKFMNSVIDNII